jgi:hypothetical protein
MMNVTVSSAIGNIEMNNNWNIMVHYDGGLVEVDERVLLSAQSPINVDNLEFILVSLTFVYYVQVLYEKEH